MSSDKPQVIPPGESGHSVDVQSLPVSALKGILNKLNEKSQTTTRLFNKSYIITTEDLRQLITKVTQEFHYTSIISRSATVSITLARNQRHDFTSWEEFKQFDTSQAEKTSSLQVEMTFDVVRNDGETPERYVIQVSIQNFPHDSFGFILGSMALAKAGEFPAPPAPLSATIRYNNYILGKNLIATIENWESTLEVREQKVVRNLQKNPSLFPEIGFFIGTVSGIILAGNLSAFYSGFKLEDVDFRLWIMWAALAVFTFSFFGRISGKFAERHVDRYTPGNNITLTKGDHNFEKNLLKRNKESLLKAGFGTLIILMQLIVGVWVSDIVPPLKELLPIGY